MRNTAKSDTIKKIAVEESLPLEIFRLDVDDGESVMETVKEITDKMKKIDILVNSAGYGLFGALEDISLGQIKRQFETNFFGTIRTMKEVLPTMRKQRNGIIINITSIAGVVGIPGECIYSSSKFALEGLSESISYELQPHGIKVILIEPGVINSNFVPNIEYPDVIEKDLPESGINKFNHNIGKSRTPSSHYAKTVEASLSHYYSLMKSAPPPALVSNVIVEAIKAVSSSMTSSQSLFRYTVGEKSKALAAAKRNMPDLQLHEYISKIMLG